MIVSNYPNVEIEIKGHSDTRMVNEDFVSLSRLSR